MSSKTKAILCNSIPFAQGLRDRNFFRLFLVLFLVTIIFLQGRPAYCEPLGAPAASAQRVCTNTDIIGKHYKLVYLDETPKRGEAAFYHEFPYHYMIFYPNYTYSFIGTNHELFKPLDLDKKLLWPLRNKRLLQFYLSSKGELTMYFNKAIWRKYNCSTITSTQGDFQQGDVILYGYTKKAKSKVYKLYRFWY